MTFDVGDRVKDKDSEDSEAVVVNQTEATAMEFSIPSARGTVASLNPDYDPMSKVTEVAFVDELERKLPQWAFMNESDFSSVISEQQIKTYYYPCDRLKYVQGGLVNGVVIKVSGVADPIEQDSGAYAVQVESEEVLFEDSSVVNVSNHPVGNVNVTTSGYIGLKKALEWVSSRNIDYGVLIRTDDKKIVRQIDGTYNFQNAPNRQLYIEVSELFSSMPYVGIQEITRNDNRNLRDKAAGTFESNSLDVGEEDSDVSVEKVVNDEYIVDGLYAVNVSHDTCTCEETGDCEHLELVRNESNVD
jgi:ribonuclease HI